ncbi:ABC transporter permease [uncultured Jannaschia sp.]|uniref:ABC transporter permease n=1 Tax=uncultured Jannaschia sp. TaxID=293347 RepID=UPI00261991CA|nr:ABC transporter permease [uncultured Jannaschia sp.]
MTSYSTDDDTAQAESHLPLTRAEKRQARRIRRFDNPWLNPKLIWGAALLLGIVALGLIGRLLWDLDLVFTGSAPLKLPPVGFENLRGQPGVGSYPLGTDGAGRDMLAMIVVGAPNTLFVGLLASLIGMSAGIALGFSAGFIGGRVDDTIRVLADVMITIPPLLILVVFQTSYGDVSLTMMALLIAGFVWQSPTRLIRAQVLSMKRSGYVQMAQLSGASTPHIMFREMLPNLVPYLFGSFIASVTTSIVTAVGLEVLGLGPQRIPTLGRTIYEAINAGALIQNLWWWWGIPTILLAVIFIGLLLINLGLDEVSNPRLRKLS